MGNINFWATSNDIKTSSFSLQTREYAQVRDGSAVIVSAVPQHMVTDREEIREALKRAKAEYGKAFQRLAEE